MSLTFANKVTIGRILIVPFFIATLLYYTPQRPILYDIALGLFLMAVISDVIDGYIARMRKQKTRAGAILDPLADKLLLISAFLCLYRMGDDLGAVRFPMWLVVAVISRDVILLIGSMLLYLFRGNLEISPSSWGKATTFFQVASILGIFFQWTFSEILWYVTVVLTLISAVDYLRNGIKILNEHTA